MPVLKAYKCETHGDFEAALSICPTCKRRAKRSGIAEIVASRTPPGMGSAKYKNTNRLLETALRDQGLVDYTNKNCHAGEAGKAKFRSEWQHTSGLNVGYGFDFLHKISGGAQLASLDMDSVKTGNPQYNPVNPHALLPEGLSAVTTPDARIGSAAQLRARTTLERGTGGVIGGG